MKLVLFRMCDYVWSTNHLKSKHTLIYKHYQCQVCLLHAAMYNKMIVPTSAVLQETEAHHNHRTMQESELWGRCVCVQFFLLTFPQGRWSGLLSIMHQLYWNSINTRGGNAFPILASHSKLVFYPTFWRQAAYLWLRFRSFPQPTKLKHCDAETFGLATWW